MNVLATKFNTKSLLLYALPTIGMMLFMSTYSIVDGIFVAQLVGEDALSAVNIVMPLINVLLAIGLMFSTGGSAVMGNLMGQGRGKEACSFLSVLYLIALGLGLLLTAIFLLFPEQLVRLLGASDRIFPYAVDYLIALAMFSVIFFFQIFIQSFFVLAGKPMLGFGVCFACGITNMVLDYFLIAPEWGNMGIAGAGWATGIANTIPAICGLLFFCYNRKGTLYFAKPVWRWRTVLHSMSNGLSELVGQLSIAVTTFMFNVILQNLAGESGVAAISMILYIQMMQSAVCMGYASGIAPVISYKHGAQDYAQLRKIVHISFVFLGIVSLAVIAISLLFDDYAVAIFISPNSPTFAMSKEGLRIFSISYLFMGINIFISALFTALSNGLVSALISFARTCVFLVASLLLLPMMLGLVGVWLAVPLAEGLACVLAMYCYRRCQTAYQY